VRKIPPAQQRLTCTFMAVRSHMNVSTCATPAPKPAAPPRNALALETRSTSDRLTAAGCSALAASAACAGSDGSSKAAATRPSDKRAAASRPAAGAGAASGRKQRAARDERRSASGVAAAGALSDMLLDGVLE